MQFFRRLLRVRLAAFVVPVAMAVVMAAAGCGPGTYPVTLSFRLADGSALADGFAVVEHATDPAILGGGPIGADGQCRPLLRGQSSPGLPEGSYRIGLAGPPVADADEPAPRLAFALRHTNPATSGLTVEVGPQSPPEAVFTLETAVP
jgi:hypothetical protein